MESNIIKTYLLDYIFDILENPKFKCLVYPQVRVNDSTGLKLNPSTSSVGKAESHSIMDYNSHIFMIHESFMVCISKVLNLLFIEKTLNSSKLYNEMFERLGEGILSIVYRYMLTESRNSRKGKLKEGQSCGFEDLFEQNYIF